MKIYIPIFMLFLMTHSVYADRVALNKVMAIVNNQIITQNDLNDKLTNLQATLQHQNKAMPNEKKLKQQALNELVNEELQLQRAAAHGIQIDDQGVDALIGDLAKQHNLSMEQLKQAIQSEGVSFETYKKIIKTQYLVSTLKQQEIFQNIDVSEQEINAALKSPVNKEKFSQASYRVGHQLIPLPENPTPLQLTKAKDQATQLIRSLEKNTPDIALDDLGWKKLAELPTLFTNVLPTMNKNGVLSIESESGLHVIKLIDKHDPTLISDAQKRQQIVHQLKIIKAERKVESWLKQLRHEASIQYAQSS